MNDQTVLFQKGQLGVRHVFAFCLNVKLLYSTILQPRRLGHGTLVGGVLPLCRDAVRTLVGRTLLSSGVRTVCFTATADWTTGHLLGESYLSTEVRSVCFTALVDWSTRLLLEESYLFAEVQSVCVTALADWTTGQLLGESYLYGGSVGVFYCPS